MNVVTNGGVFFSKIAITFLFSFAQMSDVDEDEGAARCQKAMCFLFIQEKKFKVGDSSIFKVFGFSTSANGNINIRDERLFLLLSKLPKRVCKWLRKLQRWCRFQMLCMCGHHWLRDGR
jgi:hypothetical protein